MFRRFWNTIRNALARFRHRHREPALETFSEPVVHIGVRPQQMQPPPPAGEEGVFETFSEPAVHFEVKPRRKEQSP
jgi:hypothetical protein